MHLAQFESMSIGKWLKAYSLLPNAQQAFIGQAKELNTLAGAIEMRYK